MQQTNIVLQRLSVFMFTAHPVSLYTLRHQPHCRAYSEQNIRQSAETEVRASMALTLTLTLRDIFMVFSLYLVVYAQAYNNSLTTVASVTMGIATRYQMHSVYLLHSSSVQGKFREIEPRLCLHVVTHGCSALINMWYIVYSFGINHFHAKNGIYSFKNDLIPCTDLKAILDM
jgi:hypothetical protein